MNLSTVGAQKTQKNVYIESCTLHDDHYLTFHDIYVNKTDATECNSKAHQCAGGFSLNIKNDNRFILWRIIGNKLELIEHSLTNKLNGNFKRITFKDSMIIPKIHIQSQCGDYELNFNIFILIATTSKLYRLILPFNKNEHATNSVFCNMSASDFTNIDAYNSYQINLSQVDNADIFVNHRNEALFAFVLPSSAVCCVQMPTPNLPRPMISTPNNQNLPSKFEINQPNLVKRFWSGIKRTNQDSSSLFVSYKFFCLNDSTYLMSLCKDFKLKIWCIKTNQCIHVEDLIKYFKTDTIIWDESKIDAISNRNSCNLTIVITTNDQFKICNLRIETRENLISINEISKGAIQKNGILVDVHLTKFNTWIMFKDEKEFIQIQTIPTNDYTKSNSLPNEISIISLHQYEKSKSRFKSSHANDSNEEDEDDEEDIDEERIYDKSFTDLDLKEVYLKLIFEPYRFSKSNILKSLGILGQHTINENNQMSKTNDELKELIISSIERAVQNHPNYANFTEEEFFGLNFKYWSKYYTMLKQYDYDSRMPLGLYVDPYNESAIILVRKNSISMFSEADLLQYYQATQIESIKSCFYGYLHGESQETDVNDLHYVFKSIKCINDHIAANAASLLNTRSDVEDAKASIIHYINNLTDDLTKTSEDFFISFCSILDKIHNSNDLHNKIGLILEFYDVNKVKKRMNYLQSGSADDDDNNDDLMETDSSNYVTITSDLTIDSVLASFRELINKRCEFFRNFCVFINIISKFYHKLEISREVANEINQKYSEIVLNYLNSFEYLKWLTEIYPFATNPKTLEKSVRRTFDLLEDFQLEQLKTKQDLNQLLLKSFLSICNKFSISSLTDKKQLPITNYSQLNNYLSTDILSFVWPMNIEDNFFLLKFLLHNIQYVHLNNYCVYTKWWSTAKNLRHFLMGNCCLFFNNIDQSITFFLKASYNLDKDLCLRKFMNLNRARKCGGENKFDTSRVKNNRRSIIVNKRTIERLNRRESLSMSHNRQSLANEFNVDLDDENLLLLDYYTRIIHYYDLNGNLEAAIELIQNALLNCQFDQASKSKLYCILFKSYMDLEYFDKAHNALMSNLDLEWRKTSLKHFIVELCNQNKTSTLVSFDYGDLLVDVIGILYKRAQSSDLKVNDYYRILYSIHVKIKDFRRAAFYMYECAMRLRKEINGINSLKRQEKCLLICLNLLKLVDRKFAWIPIVNTNIDENEKSNRLFEQNLKLLNNQFNDMNQMLTDNNVNLDLVDYDDINKNYMIVHYMIKLSSIISNQSSIASFYSVDELLALLVKYGLFDDAITVCLTFKPAQSSPLVNIIVGLVDRCCNLNAGVITAESDANLTNELSTEYEIIKYNESLPGPLTPYENPCGFKWKLLHFYLEKFNDVVYYKHACKRLLTLGYEIPTNILCSFRKLNTTALLQILVNYGYWKEGLELVNDYVMSLLQNSGLDRFDIKNPLVSSPNCQVILPYMVIDNLISMSQNSTDKDLKNAEIELRKTIDQYLMHAQDTTDSIINMKRKASY